MEKRNYSEKEISIFNGLITLTKNGINPYNVKVSDIAKAADVGKGTIYDYFSSKEEAISKALIYNINNELEDGSLRVISKKTFKEKFYEILKVIAEGMESNLCSFNILLSSGGLQEFYDYLVKEKYDLSEFKLKIDNVIDDLLSIGFAEEVISIKEGEYYQRMAIRSCIAGFSHYIGRKNLYKEISVEEGMDVAYRLILKTLN